MPQGIKACVPQVLRPHSSRALELQLLSPHVLEPMLYKRSLCTTTKDRPHLPQLEKARTQQQRPSTAQNKQFFFFLRKMPNHFLDFPGFCWLVIKELLTLTLETFNFPFPFRYCFSVAFFVSLLKFINLLFFFFIKVEYPCTKVT